VQRIVSFFIQQGTKSLCYTTFEVFATVKIQVEIWFVKPCSVMVGYQCFGGSCFLHLHGEMNGAVKGA